MKILVVEQPRRPTLSLGGLLQALGYDVIQRSDWRLVRELVRREEVGVVLLDACLPRLEEERPLWLVPQVRENPPALLLFGELEQENIERLGLALGTTESFGKDTPDALVVRAVEDVLRDWQRREEKRGPHSATTVPPRPGMPSMALTGGAGEKRVLVIDEDSVQGDRARRALNPAGYLVKWAGNWAEVTGELLSGPESCGVVLLEANLPTTSGADLIQVIRETHTVAPVVLLWSGLRSVELDALAQRFDADGYLTKSVNPEGLVRRVELAYQEYRRRAERAVRR